MLVASLIFGVSISFILPAVSVAQCPNDSIQSVLNKRICYYFGNQKIQYLLAEAECQTKGGHLANTKNKFEDIYLAQQANKRFNSSQTSDFWFGLNKMEKNAWTWLDGTKFEYSNWDKNEPQNETVETICGALAFAGGHWSAQDCYKVKPFVCAFTTQI